MAKSRFLISALPNPTEEEYFNNFLTEKNITYWHWIPGTWLVVAPTSITQTILFDWVKLAFPNKAFAVHTITTDYWYINADADGIDWLTKNWYTNPKVDPVSDSKTLI